MTDHGVFSWMRCSIDWFSDAQTSGSPVPGGVYITLFVRSGTGGTSPMLVRPTKDRCAITHFTRSSLGVVLYGSYFPCSTFWHAGSCMLNTRMSVAL